MAAKVTNLEFDEFHDAHLSVFLVKNVQNPSEINKLIVSGSLNPEASVINAALIPDIFILHTAARAALVSQQQGNLRARSLHAEVVVNTSGTKHIAESLRRYGVNDSCHHLLVSRFNATEKELKQLQEVIEGELAPIEELPAVADEALLRRYHKIVDKELEVGSLVDAIIARMAAKDVM